MNPSLNNKKNSQFDLWLYYQCALAIGAIFAFFTDINSYLYLTGANSATPLFWIKVLCVASLPLFISQIKNLPRPVIVWCVGYILISLLWFLLFSVPKEIVIEETRKRVLAVIFLITTLVIFSGKNTVQTWARLAVLIAVFIGVLNNISDFLNPGIFSTSLSNFGRAAGYYLNPNNAGAALVLGMIVSLLSIQPKYRFPFVLIVGLGVLLTFSRGAILGWFIVVIILSVTRVIPVQQLLPWVVKIGVIIIGFGSLWQGFLTNLDLEKNTLERIEWFQKPSGSEDSADSRLEIAKLGWKLFADQPFLGNGIASTITWDQEISTHNMYIYLMADYGILGAFIFPLLVYAVTRDAQGEIKYIGWAFAAFILLWGLFSHNILEERYILIMFSLMAAMTRTSLTEHKSQIGHLL